MAYGITTFADGSAVALTVEGNGLKLAVETPGPIARRTVKYLTQGTGDVNGTAADVAKIAKWIATWKVEQDAKFNARKGAR